MISISHDSTVATLDSGTVSYILEVVDGKYLVHRYYGRHLRSYHGCGERPTISVLTARPTTAPFPTYPLMIFRLNTQCAGGAISVFRH